MECSYSGSDKLKVWKSDEHQSKFSLVIHKVIKPSGDAVEDKSKSLVSMASKLHKLLVKKEAARTANKKLLFYIGWCSKSWTLLGKLKKTPKHQRSSCTEGIANNIFSWSTVALCLLHVSCSQICLLKIVSLV